MTCLARPFIFSLLLMLAGLPARWILGSSAEMCQPTEADCGAPQVGAPNAPGMVALMQQEILEGFRQRRIESDFARFQAFARHKLDTTAGGYRGGEVTGICRLGWFDHMLRNVIEAPAEAERFTRSLHESFLKGHEGFDEVLCQAAVKLDLRQREPRRFNPIDSPRAALDQVRRSLIESQAAFAAALEPLSRSEIRLVADSSYSIFTTSANNGHTLPNRSTARTICELIKKMNREKLHDAAAALVPLCDRGLLDQLGEFSTEQTTMVEGASGTILARIATAAGDIVIGGRGANTYQLDAMEGVSAVIDLGGDDVYQEGSVSLARPLLVILDLGGNDTYQGSKPGIQGGALLGVSMLVDVEGDDVYQAKDIAQGSALAGAGILIDYAGDDTYVGLRRVQGHALGGIGVIWDQEGNDRYHAAMWAQGFGNPLGFGVLEDTAGDDTYYCGGLYYDSYPETPGYEGWGQGIGAGLRDVADGGIGVILDGGGDDTYEFDYIAHGGGYWLGLGFARDFGGDDKRLGATRKMYNGGARRERSFQRFSNGFGCHYALGFLIDDAGDDTYGGTIMGLGFAWDCAVAYLMDFGGNDRYEATGGGTQGQGRQAGLGVLFDYDGDDVYLGSGQGLATAQISYHSMPSCGGNFSFVIDYGGTDQYGCRARNNSYNKRGNNGFVIDRPRNGSSTETVGATNKQATPGD